MPDPIGAPVPRPWLGPLCLDTVGPVVSDALALVRALAPALSPARRLGCQADAALVDRLLRETSRPHPRGRVLGGRTGLALIAALARLVTAAREDLADRPDPESREAAALIVEVLETVAEHLEAAIATLEAERAEDA
jgi:hypothetical protein